MIYFCNVRKSNFTWGLRRVINGDGGGGGKELYWWAYSVCLQTQLPSKRGCDHDHSVA